MRHSRIGFVKKSTSLMALSVLGAAIFISIFFANVDRSVSSKNYTTTLNAFKVHDQLTGHGMQEGGGALR